MGDARTRRLHLPPRALAKAGFDSGRWKTSINLLHGCVATDDLDVRTRVMAEGSLVGSPLLPTIGLLCLVLDGEAHQAEDQQDQDQEQDECPVDAALAASDSCHELSPPFPKCYMLCSPAHGCE